MNEEIEKKIIETIDKIRPFLQNDGGDIKFVKFENGIVYVQMEGACSDCINLDSTITDGVEMILMDEVSGIIGVEVIKPSAN